MRVYAPRERALTVSIHTGPDRPDVPVLAAVLSSVVQPLSEELGTVRRATKEAGHNYQIFDGKLLREYLSGAF